MKNIYSCFFVLGTFILLLGGLNVFSQDEPEDPIDKKARQEAQAREYDRLRKKNASASEPLGDVSSVRLLRQIALDKVSAENNEQRIKREKLAWEEFDRQIGVSVKYLDKFDSFLEKENTGIFVLSANFDCKKQEVISTGSRCAKVIPNTYAFSFRARRYPTDTLGDISFNNGFLTVGGLLAPAIIVRLGSRPLESLSLESFGVKPLVDFVRAKNKRQLRPQFKQIAAGMINGNNLFSNRTKALTGNTYVVRLIAYRIWDRASTSVQRAVANSRYRRSTIGMHDFKPNIADITVEQRRGRSYRRDIIVAFRIVGKDADGRITLLWKELSNRKSPRITMKKSDVLSNYRF